MAGMTQDTPQAPGPNGSMPFGEASQISRERRALQSIAPAPQQPSAPSPGDQPPPGGVPLPTPQTAPPVQPAPPDPGTNSRIDMNAVFPPMPELQLRQQPPWRQQLRTFAITGGPRMRYLADMIRDQHGPTY